MCRNTSTQELDIDWIATAWVELPKRSRVLALTISLVEAKDRLHTTYVLVVTTYLLPCASFRESRRLSMTLSISPRDCWTTEIPMCLR